MGMYRTKSQRILKKYLDAVIYGSWAYGPNETKRESVFSQFSHYSKRKKLNKYVNKYVENPDMKADKPERFSNKVKINHRKI